METQTFTVDDDNLECAVMFGFHHMTKRTNFSGVRIYAVAVLTTPTKHEARLCFSDGIVWSFQTERSEWWKRQSRGLMSYAQKS